MGSVVAGVLLNLGDQIVLVGGEEGLSAASAREVFVMSLLLENGVG